MNQNNTRQFGITQTSLADQAVVTAFVGKGFIAGMSASYRGIYCLSDQGDFIHNLSSIEN